MYVHTANTVHVGCKFELSRCRPQNGPTRAEIVASLSSETYQSASRRHAPRSAQPAPAGQRLGLLPAPRYRHTLQYGVYYFPLAEIQMLTRLTSLAEHPRAGHQTYVQLVGSQRSRQGTISIYTTEVNRTEEACHTVISRRESGTCCTREIFTPSEHAVATRKPVVRRSHTTMINRPLAVVMCTMQHGCSCSTTYTGILVAPPPPSDRT